MGYLFTSESVSEGHPDKVCDQISDALLDEFLRQDPDSKVACETFATTGLVVCGGEVKTNGYVHVDEIVRRTIRKIGYTKAEYRFDSDSCGVITAIHEQSSDINQGVERKNAEDQGAGDQGMMFGYACKEMDNYMPLPIELAHILLQELAVIRKEGKLMTYLRPDAKSQVTVEYDDNAKPVKIDTIVISTQHDDFDTEKNMQKKIKEDIQEILLPRVLKTLPKRIQDLFNLNCKLFVNPTGKFVIGGPHGDTGLTGRKIIVDTYGGMGRHGGGAFSGKDSTKVDRSGAYMARYAAKNIVAAGLAERVEIQVSYAIGVPFPVSLLVDTFGTGKIPDEKIAEAVSRTFDFSPSGIIRSLDLRKPIFSATATYGHFGREGFSWEAIDKVADLQKAVG